jgi:hypothetical protein
MGICSRNGSLFWIASGEITSSNPIDVETTAFAASGLVRSHAIVDDIPPQHLSSRVPKFIGSSRRFRMKILVCSEATLLKCAFGTLDVSFLVKFFIRL